MGGISIETVYTTELSCLVLNTQLFKHIIMLVLSSLEKNGGKYNDSTKRKDALRPVTGDYTI